MTGIALNLNNKCPMTRLGVSSMLVGLLRIKRRSNSYAWNMTETTCNSVTITGLPRGLCGCWASRQMHLMVMHTRTLVHSPLGCSCPNSQLHKPLNGRLYTNHAHYATVTIGLVTERCSIRIQAETLPGRCCSLFSVVPRDKMQDDTYVRPRPLPAKSFPTGHSSIRAQFDDIRAHLGRMLTAS
jgi:hypothetical protein